MTSSRHYGWFHDSPDARDHLFAAEPETLVSLPSSADLRPLCPPVYDQGRLGSCTANAIAAAVEFDLKKQGLADFVPSRLFIYYGEREIEGTIGEDAGAELRDGIKAVATLGVCPETAWPYDIARFAEKPPQAAYDAALKDKAVSYARVPQGKRHMKACLAAGYPFAIGFTVYESFESAAVARTGVVPMPTWREEVMGGHAVLVVGYDDAAERFIARNSWNSSWGQDGYFTVPYHYFANPSLASDLWTVRLVG
jgi:C1A family cysteine protease